MKKKVYCLKCIVNNDNKKCFICDNKIKPFEEFFKTIVNASQDIIDEERSITKDIDINCQVCWKPTDTKLNCDCKARICRTCLTQAWNREYRGERPLNPLFGSDIKKTLFDPIVKDTLDGLELQVREGIESFFPLVNIKELVITSDTDFNQVNVSLTYSVFNNELDKVNIDFNTDE